MAKMQWTNGVVDRMSVGAPIASYRYGRMTIKCFQNNGLCIIQFHNGRQSGRVGWTEDKELANEYIKKALADGFKKERRFT